MFRDIFRQFVLIVTFIATVVVNGLANALPLNGFTTGSISDRFSVFFVPAGYVFSIWGVIYLLLLAFTVFQALPSQRQNPVLRKVGYLPALSGVLNSVWIVFWHYEQFPLTLLVMAALLVTLILTYVRFGIGRAKVSTAVKWMTHIPFSVYLGWITVATVANVTQFLYMNNWDGFGISALAWGVIMLIVGAIVAGAVIFTRRDIAYTMVIVGAYVGIVVKQTPTPTIAATAGIVAALVAVMLIIVRVMRRNRVEVNMTGGACRTSFNASSHAPPVMFDLTIKVITHERLNVLDRHAL